MTTPTSASTSAIYPDLAGKRVVVTGGGAGKCTGREYYIDAGYYGDGA